MTLIVLLRCAYLGELMFLFVVALSIVSEGVVDSIMPVLALKIFGNKKGPLIYAYLCLSITLSSLLGFALER